MPWGRLWEMRVGCVGEGEGVVERWWRTWGPRISIDFLHAADAVEVEAFGAVEAARGCGVGVGADCARKAAQAVEGVFFDEVADEDGAGVFAARGFPGRGVD